MDEMETAPPERDFVKSSMILARDDPCRCGGAHPGTTLVGCGMRQEGG
jgi:hypothetical protein